jgi:acyl-CoA hydrolase
MTATNASLEVDFLGQCASESLGSEYWSSSGGQPDFREQLHADARTLGYLP